MVSTTSIWFLIGMDVLKNIVEDIGLATDFEIWLLFLREDYFPLY